MKVTHLVFSSLIVGLLFAAAVAPWFVDGIPFTVAVLVSVVFLVAAVVLYLFIMRAIRVQILPTLIALAGIQVIFAAPLFRVKLLELLTSYFSEAKFLQTALGIYQQIVTPSKQDYLLIGTGLILVALAVYASKMIIGTLNKVHGYIKQYWGGVQLPSYNYEMEIPEAIKALNAINDTTVLWGDTRSKEYRKHIAREVHHIVVQWLPVLENMKNPLNGSILAKDLLRPESRAMEEQMRRVLS